jgi:ribonuclease HI
VNENPTKALTEPVVIYTDGACSGNPGPGGWAAILKWRDKEKTLSGAAPITTNNIMELTAVIRALEALKRPVPVIVATDSRYVMDGITRWLKRWKQNGWQTTDKRPVKNVELWQQLDNAAARHVIEWRWVKGHSGDSGNERADKLARAAISQLTKSL